MNPIELLLTALASGSLTSLVANILTARHRRRQAAEEAETVALNNDTVRLTTYQNIVADLDQRLQRAMQQMRTLEDEIMHLRNDNQTLRKENATLRVRIEELEGQVSLLTREGGA